MKIEPALNPSMWAAFEEGAIGNLVSEDFFNVSERERVIDIAILNASLRDDNPYKITRAMVEIIRQAGHRLDRENNPYLGFAKNLSRYADKLAALLPPQNRDRSISLSSESSMERVIQLGHIVRDAITQFEGVVIGQAKYLTGCEQSCVQPRALTVDGKIPESRWFDDDRLNIVVAPKLELPRHDADGCDVIPPSL